MDQASTPLNPKILVAPLDWGLGHATRCIPLIRQLLRHHCEVHLAGDGPIRVLLQQEFPQLPFHELKGYDISYSRSKWSLPFVMATQIPKILAAIQYENERAYTLVETLQLDGIISDNRYGLYHQDIPSVFMSHQLLIKTNLGKTADEYLQKLNYSYIENFTECWVPDYEGSENLSGALSHPPVKPNVPVRYLGPLSRFSATASAPGHQLLLLLSGPEPQRSLFEESLLGQLKDHAGPVVLVRGLPANGTPLSAMAGLEIFDHLPAAELQKKLESASLVISRCGYSTVMDLAAMKKKSILVPTPGQTEQEYLATYLMQKNFALSIAQEKFRLKPLLELAAHFNYKLEDPVQQPTLEQAVHGLLETIRQSGSAKKI